MRRSSVGIRVSALVIVALLVAGLAGSALAARASTPVKVTMSEFKFVLSTKTVSHGAVVFTITNKGKLPHDFKIAGKKTALIGPGKSGKLTVTLKAGKYPYQCTVAGHAAAGMKGVLSVK